jgi:putative glutamine amidotransferase
MTRSHPPLIGVTACLEIPDDARARDRSHRVGEKYLTAVTEAVGAMPVILPALADGVDLAALVARLDGLMLTGSPSNVAPHHYGGADSLPGTLHDPARDAVTLPLIRLAVAAGLPLLGLCRGHQELNVALGGTLHQTVQDLPGRRDHRAPNVAPWQAKYAAAHVVRLTPGGLFQQLAGGRDEIAVNSLHAQAIDRPATDLAIEATAPDGIIEGVRVLGAPAFAVGIQWHPEFRPREDAFAAALFNAFGDAARRRADTRVPSGALAA